MKAQRFGFYLSLDERKQSGYILAVLTCGREIEMTVYEIRLKEREPILACRPFGYSLVDKHVNMLRMGEPNCDQTNAMRRQVVIECLESSMSNSETANFLTPKISMMGVHSVAAFGQFLWETNESITGLDRNYLTVVLSEIAHRKEGDSNGE